MMRLSCHKHREKRMIPKISNSDRVRSLTTLTIPSKESCPKSLYAMVWWEQEGSIYQDFPCFQKALSAELSLLTKPKRGGKALFLSVPTPPTLSHVHIQLLNKPAVLHSCTVLIWKWVDGAVCNDQREWGCCVTCEVCVHTDWLKKQRK